MSKLKFRALLTGAVVGVFCTYGSTASAQFPLDKLLDGAKKLQQLEQQQARQQERQGQQQPSRKAAPEGPADCPRSFDYRNLPEGLYELVRCPSLDDISLDRETGKKWREAFWQQLLHSEPKELDRAISVRICALSLRDRSLSDPNLLTCLWHADVLDKQKLEAELASRPGDIPRVLRRADADRALIASAAEKELPKESFTREYEIFHTLPTQVKEAHERRRVEDQGKELQAAVAAFEAGWRQGEVAGCEQALEPVMRKHLAGVKGPYTDVAARLGDELGYPLTTALAKCYFLSNREADAAVLLAALGTQTRRVTLGEKIYWAQVEALAQDEEGLKKMPHLKGKKFSAYTKELPWRGPPEDEASEGWWRTARDLREKVSRTSGVVARVVSGDKRIEFKKTQRRVPVDKCRETNKVEYIDANGRVFYQLICTPNGYKTETSKTSPVTVSDVAAISPGNYVRALSVGTSTTVEVVTPEDDMGYGNLRRLGPLVIE